MATIAIQNLQKVNSITELEDSELNATTGGIDPVTAAVAGAIIFGGSTAFYNGYKSGIRLYDVTQND